MRNNTRAKFHAFIDRQAELNGVETQGGGEIHFSVEPTVGQVLEQRVQEQADFLQRISVTPVDEIKGEKVGMFGGSTIASRTDTDANDRQTQDPTGLDSEQYECSKTNFDTHLKYARLDAWAKFPTFQTMWQNIVVEQMARDRMMIGFNGTSRAANSDRSANPLLQDVNVGWLEKIRQNASGARHLASYDLSDTNNDSRNVDALVMEAIASFIDPWHQNSADMVVIAGRHLLSDKYTALVSTNETPTERVALQTLMSNKNLGARPTITVPFFPDDALLIADLRALSIYYQESSRRRTIVDNAKRDRVEDYQSVNEDYVVEDHGAVCFIEGITGY